MGLWARASPLLDNRSHAPAALQYKEEPLLGRFRLPFSLHERGFRAAAGAGPRPGRAAEWAAALDSGEALGMPVGGRAAREVPLTSRRRRVASPSVALDATPVDLRAPPFFSA